MAGVVNLESRFTPEENERAEECAKKVQEVLEQFGCQIAPIAYLTNDGRIEAEAHIIVKREVQIIKAVPKTPFLVRP